MQIVQSDIGFGTVQSTGNPVQGVRVYAQWYEGENTQHSSPVYYTETDAQGNFTINMAPYTDADGVIRTFRADASVGLLGDGEKSRDQLREKIRVWTELPADKTDKYRLVHQPAAGIFPGIGANTTPTTQGDHQWGGNKITGMTIQFARKDNLPQHLPKEKWTESSGKATNEGSYAGRAFWNLDVLQGAKNHNTVSSFDGKDVPAAGLKVVGSYLTDEAVKKIEQYAKANFGGKELRSRNKKEWTGQDEAGLQKWINEQVAADPEGWIAETVTTTTGADGSFQLFWKGLYGSFYDRPGLVPQDKAGTLAGSHDEGKWTNGASDSKHINLDWSYVNIYDKDGNPLPDNIGALQPWSLGYWMGPNFFSFWKGGDAQFFGGDTVFIGHTTDGYTGWNIALAPQALKFDVVDKNTTDNWATIGDKVQTDTSGLPFAQNLNYYIQWVDKNGKVVKTCETRKADSATKIPSCELEVPADAQTGDTFTARLKVTAGNPDPDNDLILAMDAFAVARDYLAYDPVDAKRGKEATSNPKFDNPATETEETTPDKAKFVLGKLPEGVTEDQVKVDPATGVVTFTPKADQAAKAYSFPVVMRNEELQVPVIDENGDPVKDGSGNPKTQGRIVARADATFNVAELTANTVEPEYKSELVVPGQETKSSPTFTDKDGKDATAPEGSTFKITDGFTVPEGYVVEINESNGEITVTFPDGSKLNKDTTEEFDVPVTVTYPDESTDEVKANFKLDTDGDGDPDVTDPDDDGDGIPDEDDSNPKVPNVNDHFDPKYEDGSGKPGSDVKIDAPTFTDKDGKDTEAPENTKFTPGENAPDGVTVDETTGEITVEVPDTANPGDEIKVPVVVTYPDGTKDNVEVTVTVTEKDNGVFEPKYKSELVVPGQETKSAPSFTDKDGKDATAPEGSTFKITDGFTVPEGYVVEINESTGEITVTFPDGSKLNKDTTEEFDVPVTVTYPDESTDEVKANFKLDTDGDGDPDVTDPDDDGDGIPDEDDSNPKVPNVNDHFDPKYTDGSGKPGSDVKIDAPTFTDKDGKDTEAPENTKFTPGENAPDGVTVDETTGEITVKVPDTANPGDEIKVPVVVTYPDGTKDNVEVTVTVTEKDNGVFEPKYKSELVVPGQETKSAPSFTDKEGKDATAPEGSTFKITDGFTVPEGYVVEINESTGEITVTFPDGSKLNKDTTEEFDVPVTVTYPDGSTDKTDANFKLDTDGDGTPDVTDEDDDGDGIPDKVEKDKGSNPKNKGSIPATPLEPGKPTNAAIFEPKYKSELVVPGQETKSAPSFTDKEGKDVEVPADSKFTIGEDFTAPEGYEVSIDENNGEITVTFPDESKLSGETVEEFDVPVTVTYPDESTDEVKANFKLDTDGDGTPDVTDEDDDGDGIPDKDDSNPKVPNANDHYDPKYTDGSGKPGSDVKIDKPVFKDNNGEETTAPEGTKFTPGDKAPEGVTVNEDGSITVKVPEDATPGSKIEVPVVVTYPDGSTDEVTVTVTAIGDYAVKYDPAKGKVDEDIVAEPKSVGKHEAPADTKYAAGKKETHDGLWTISDPAQDGKITAKVDSKALKDRYISERDKAFGKKCEDGAVITEQDAKDFLKKFAQLFNAKSAVDVTFTPEDKQQVEATFTLVDADGKPLAENQDWDRDGVSNVEEIQNCSNPFDKSDVEDSKTLEPSFKYPAWDNATTVPGESVDINKTQDSGDFTPGTTVDVTSGPGKAEIDENGKITVTPTPEAKVGDKIVVEVKDPNGKVIDTVEVEITSHELSSRKGCTESLLGFGIPLLALIPLGIAMQAAIPGLQSFQAQVNQQIQDMNTALQRQMGILDPNMARAAADFNARLQGAGANLGQVLAGLAVLAYGVAAIVTIATTCDPKNPEKRDSKLDFSSALGKTGEGSSSEQEGEKGSSGQTEGSSRQTDTEVAPEPEQPAPGVEENNDAPQAADDDAEVADAEVEENPAN